MINTVVELDDSLGLLVVSQTLLTCTTLVSSSSLISFSFFHFHSYILILSNTFREAIDARDINNNINHVGAELVGLHVDRG